MSLGVLPWVCLICDSLCFLDLGGYFLPHFRDIFNYYLLKYLLMPFLFIFFWDSYDSNVVALDLVPEVSEVVLISFHSFFLSASFIYRQPNLSSRHSIFHLMYPIFCLSYSTVGSLQSVFDLNYCIIHY